MTIMTVLGSYADHDDEAPRILTEYTLGMLGPHISIRFQKRFMQNEISLNLTKYDVEINYF